MSRPRARSPLADLTLARASFAALALLVFACSGPERAAEATGDERALDSSGPVVRPPFAVRGELDGLMLTYFDEEGAHLVEHRRDVPEAARAEVRIDSPTLAPEERDADSIFVADLRAADEHGDYVVRRVPRASFEARMQAARRGEPGVASAGGDVIIFGASWCGACHEAARYLRARGVPFVERDIEADPSARSDMIARARSAGIQPNGIPIIDVRGRILQGFDAGAIDRALAETSAARPDPASGPSAGASAGETI